MKDEGKSIGTLRMRKRNASRDREGIKEDGEEGEEGEKGQ